MDASDFPREVQKQPVNANLPQRPLTFQEVLTPFEDRAKRNGVLEQSIRPYAYLQATHRILYTLNDISQSGVDVDLVKASKEELQKIGRANALEIISHARETLHIVEDINAPQMSSEDIEETLGEHPLHLFITQLDENLSDQEVEETFGTSIDEAREESAVFLQALEIKVKETDFDNL